MRRRKSDDDAGAMDSLLDTMTNVVGILVIVLVVTQLGVGDAVQRIAETITVGPQDLKDARRELTRVDRDRNALQDELKDFDNLSEQQAQQRLQELLAQIEEQRALLRELQQRQQQREDERSRKVAAQAEALRAQAEEDARLKEELTEQLTAAEGELRNLKAMLAETPERETLPATEITLPDPRPAPEGAQPFIFVCANQKVYPLNLEAFRGEAQRRAQLLAQRMVTNPAEGIDAKRFVEAFNRTPLQDEYFRAQLSASGATPRLVFLPRETGGETERVVVGLRSRFREGLQQVDPSKYYIRFYVRSDSFDIYLAARRVVAASGLLAGWEPQGPKWNYQANLGGSLRFGPPAPPTPKPQPQPPAPQPKPQPNTQPTRPQNVID